MSSLCSRLSGATLYQLLVEIPSEFYFRALERLLVASSQASCTQGSQLSPASWILLVGLSICCTLLRSRLGFLAGRRRRQQVFAGVGAMTPEWVRALSRRGAAGFLDTVELFGVFALQFRALLGPWQKNGGHRPRWC